VQGAACSHLDQIAVPKPDAIEGCAECLRTGDGWVHLRVCRICGEVGCCDDSPNQHASKHAKATGHPIISSVEPGEAWSWCFLDEVAFALEGDR
jgi:hypothetical protein